MSLLTNLVSYYALDGNSTDSVGANNGTDTAMTYTATGALIGQMGVFNGTTSYISTADTPFNPGSGDFTINCWLKTSATGTVVAAGKYGGSGDTYWLGFVSGAIRFELKSGTYDITTTATTYNDNAWHMVSAWRASGVQYLAIDNGTPQSLANTTTIAPTGNLMLGKFGSGNTFFYPGDMDEFGYWSRALTSTEITQLYNSGAGLAYPFGLTSYTPDPMMHLMQM